MRSVDSTVGRCYCLASPSPPQTIASNLQDRVLDNGLYSHLSLKPLEANPQRHQRVSFSVAARWTSGEKLQKMVVEAFRQSRYLGLSIPSHKGFIRTSPLFLFFAPSSILKDLIALDSPSANRE